MKQKLRSLLIFGERILNRLSSVLVHRLQDVPLHRWLSFTPWAVLEWFFLFTLVYSFLGCI